MRQIELPYIYLPKLQLTVLIDTGASESIINPEIANLFPNKIFLEPFEIIACKTKFSENQNLILPIFKELGISNEIKFRVVSWHNSFDALIGTKDLVALKGIIDYDNQTLKLKNHIIPFHMIYNQPIESSNKNNNNVLQIPVTQKQGTALLPSFEINNYIIPDSLVNIKNGICTIPNPTQEIQINLQERLKVIPVEEFDIINPPEIPIKFNLDSQLRLNHLNEQEKDKIRTLCHQFKDIMYHENCDLSLTSQTTHKIRTTNDRPIYTKSYRHPPSMQKEIQLQIQKLLDNKIIRPSISPYSAPVWIVPKKTDASGKKKFRLVIDYRKLNEHTVEEKYPLPRIEEILDNLGKCMYFTTLDLAQGFHQIGMDKDSIEKTAFTVNHGHFEYLRMPFGLKNAPATFQRMMDEILRDYLYKFCFVYMDDVVIFSKSLSEHLDHIRIIFKKFREVNLKIQLDKSEFLSKEVAFLGHLITPEGIKPNPSKISAIKNYPLPKTQKEIKAFLGLVGYYRRFIKNFARIVFPMTKCLKKGTTIQPNNQDYIDAFNKCKELITNSPILTYPDFSKPFKLTTDASNYAIGSVLSQNDHPVAYYSRTLNSAEKNYSTIEKELLAILDSTKHFRPYLYGKKFTIETDHNPLVWLNKIKEPNSRLIRWRLKLEEFDFNIVYKKGKENFVADALSRIEINFGETESISPQVGNDSANLKDFEELNQEEIEIEQQKNNEEEPSSIYSLHSNKEPDGKMLPISELPVNFATRRLILTYGNSFNQYITKPFNKTHIFVRIPKENENKFLIQVMKELLNHQTLTTIFINDKNLEETFKQLVKQNLSNNVKLAISYKYLQDVTDPQMQRDIIENYHNQNHNGITETYQKLKEKYYWPKLKEHITLVINKCDICLQSKYERNPYKIPYEGPLLAEKPFKTIHIDIFQYSQCLFLTILDSFSKYAQAYFIKDKNAVTILNKLRHFISHHNVPQRIVADNGLEFKNNTFKEFCQLHNIEVHYVTPNNSTSNSPVERLHSTLIEKLRVLQQKDPNESIDNLMISTICIYNQNIHSTTGFSPFNLLYGPYYHEFEINQDLSIFEQYNEKRKQELTAFHKKVFEKTYETQKRNTEKQNKSADIIPQISNDQTIYKKNDRRNKASPNYIPIKVTSTKRNIVEGTLKSKKKTKTHLRKIKRIRKIPSFQVSQGTSRQNNGDNSSRK